MDSGRYVHNHNFIGLNFLSLVLLSLSVLYLSWSALDKNLAPLLLYLLMILMGIVVILLFAKDDRKIKIELFIFVFSLSLFYILLHDTIVLSFPNNKLPFDYIDGPTFYNFSNLALAYISGEKEFFSLFTFASYPMHDLSLHVMFSGLIAYFSTVIDGENSILIQRLLSPFFGGVLASILYSTLKHQFKDRTFVLYATLAYSLLSALFIYSTSLMRDVDIALTYMIAIYLFLQPSSKINFFLLLGVAYITLYLRTESGMVLFGIALLYSYLYVRKLESKSIRFIFYLLLVVLFSSVVLLMYPKIVAMLIDRNEVNMARAVALSSSSSIGLLLNKLPFPVNYIAKVLFGQIQPFPFLIAIDRFPEAISGIFWPLIVVTMSYALIKKRIRIFLDEKIKYLLLIAITILFLMSSEPMARRMMSVYPIMYIVSLYVFFILPRGEIKRIIAYYLFGIISLNILYYLIKL